MSDWLWWVLVGPFMALSLVHWFVTAVLFLVVLLVSAVLWPAVIYFSMRQRWRQVSVLQGMLPVRRPMAVILWALALRRRAKGREYWPHRLASRLLGATSMEQCNLLETKIRSWELMIDLVNVSLGSPTPTDAPSPTFSALVSETAPRWKACVLVFAGLTVLTVFLPRDFSWAVFFLVSAYVCWRGYRDVRIPAWGDAIRLGLIGGFVGSLIWLLLAGPLQRGALIRLSREVYVSSPEWFLCCIWDGHPPKAARQARPSWPR
jgi:hypothetical protein